MVPGGVTESIWHFIGHLHVLDDIARQRLAYEEGAYHRPTDDYLTPRPQYQIAVNLDEFPTYGRKVPEGDIPSGSSLYLTPAHNIAARPPKLPDLELEDPRKPPIPSGGGGASGGAGGGVDREAVIKVEYEPGGEQIQAEIDQLNHLHDNDVLYDEDIVTQGAEVDVEGLVGMAHPGDEDAIVNGMVDDAWEATPDELAFTPSDNMGAVEFLKAYDAALAAGDGQPSPYSVQPGLYINGELQPAGTTLPALDSPAAPDLAEGPGALAAAGSNESVNQAMIADLSESARTMLINGDYYKVNAIVQISSYIDNDDMAVGGDLQALIAAGDNITRNIADFRQEAGLYSDLPSMNMGPRFHVDVVAGDFYDVRLTLQQNFLCDNDVIVQYSSDTHFEAHTGENGQFNFITFPGGDFAYDLIIVDGSYHGGNFIFQYNVLFDNDFVRAAAEHEGGGEQSVSAGDNQLTNKGTIANYGDDDFHAPTSGMEDFIAAIREGRTDLDPSFSELFDGNGFPLFRILYVQGDYFDINAIWQINVVADMDTVIQLTDPEAEDPGVQVTITGSNALTNEAIIVDVGATTSFVMGDVYSDSMLIQTDLVAQNDDHAEVKDPNVLVTEVIAFFEPVATDSQEPESVPLGDPTPHQDMIGSMLT